MPLARAPAPRAAPEDSPFPQIHPAIHGSKSHARLTPTHPDRGSGRNVSRARGLAMAADRWSDAFLDGLRKLGDPEADEAVQTLVRAGASAGDRTRLRALFARMDSNDDLPVHSHFPELDQFFHQTNRLTADLDLARIERGERVFSRVAFDGGLSLLCKSLPEGYQAPNLAILLNLSGDLRHHTYRRLLSTLQTVVNVCSIGGFHQTAPAHPKPAGTVGRAIITAQKLRLSP